MLIWLGKAYVPMERDNYSRGLETIHDLFVHELRSVLFLEQRLEEELGQMSEEVSESELKEELINHRDQTSDHAQRLHQVFEEIGENPGAHDRPDFRGIFQEFKQLKSSTDENEIIDITALNTAIMIERIEITMYEGLLRLEQNLDIDKEIKYLLENNKDEEEAALKRLRKMSKDSWFKQLRKNLMS